MKKIQLNAIVKNAQFITRNSARVGNVIVLDVKDDLVTLLTDFGNRIVVSFKSVQDDWAVCPQYIDMLELGMPQLTIKERVEVQISLLTSVLAKLPKEC
jgi:hypothetical protein